MDILNELKIYVNSKEHSGAVLLTGSWGCGKTYLIKKFKKEIDSDEKVVLIVSLFGIDSIDSLTRAIKDQIKVAIFEHNDDSEEKSKDTKKLFRNLMKVGSAFSEKMNNINTNLSISMYELIEINKIISCFDKFSKKEKEIILVFDDFERSKIEIIELLGAINEYCENREIKVIIVADEAKIIIKDDNDKDVINPKYREFKEKVIQTTINLTTDYRNIINNIILNYEETCIGYGNFLNSNISLFYQVFYESQCNNLRTIKSILIGFERIYKVCKTHFENFEYLNDLLYSYSVMIFENRSGNFNKNEHGYLTADTSFKDKYMYYNKNRSALNSLKIFVGENEWNENNFVNEITYLYFSEKSLTFGQKFLLSDFWGLDEEIIEKGLPECVKLSYEGELTLDEYITLLNYIVTLIDFEFEIQCDISYKKMMLGLEKKKEKIIHQGFKEPRRRTLISNNKLEVLGADAVKLNEQIEMFDDKIDVWNERNNIINSLNSGCDFTGLFNKTIDCLDDELMLKIYEAYKNNDNYTRREIGRWFNSVQFDNQYCSNEFDKQITLKNMNTLIEKITNLNSDEFDKFNKIIHREFLKNLNKKIDELKEN